MWGYGRGRGKVVWGLDEVVIFGEFEGSGGCVVFGFFRRLLCFTERGIGVYRVLSFVWFGRGVNVIMWFVLIF